MAGKPSFPVGQFAGSGPPWFVQRFILLHGGRRWNNLRDHQGVSRSRRRIEHVQDLAEARETQRHRNSLLELVQTAPTPTLVTLPELESRMLRFRNRMDTDHPDWALAAIFGRINLYYFTGTIQDGVLVIPREDEAVFWVRRSIERAQEESAFPQIRPMTSYRDAASMYRRFPPVLFAETEAVPLAVFDRFRKHFPVQEIRPLDLQVLKVRSVKSPYELALMEQAGRIHRQVLEDDVPGMLRAGMSEAELATQVYSRMVELGALRDHPVRRIQHRGRGGPVRLRR